MIRTFFLFICIVGIQYSTYSQTYNIPEDVKRIVFLGNSITYHGTYIEFIETYLSIHYPNKDFEIINIGLPSETVSGLSESNHADGRFPRPDLHERLSRVLAKTNPDLVFACYGMNDGIYMPFNEERFDKYKKGINWLHEQVEQTGSEIIHITPAIYDERKGKAYANVLDIYSCWLLSNQFTNGWNVIDLHWPMKKELEEHRLKDSTFVFAKDGVHPNKAGHFVMAKQILMYLGEITLMQTNNIKSFLSSLQNGEEIYKLVEERQQMMKNSWLTFIGHKRPNMEKGLPMDKALQKSKEIENQIQVLLKQE